MKEQNEIVFLPVRKEWWNTMEPVYRQALTVPDANVVVLPVKWYRKDYDGNPYDECDETDAFSDLETVLSREKFDLSEWHPDVIVTQFPYDDTNRDVGIEEAFYARNLTKCANKVIYVPCYDVDTPEKEDEISKKALRVLIEQPAVVHADVVLLPTRGLREVYIDTLTDIAGEDTKSIWEKKVQTTDTPDLNVLLTLFSTHRG